LAPWQIESYISVSPPENAMSIFAKQNAANAQNNAAACNANRAGAANGATAANGANAADRAAGADRAAAADRAVGFNGANLTNACNANCQGNANAQTARQGILFPTQAQRQHVNYRMYEETIAAQRVGAAPQLDRLAPTTAAADAAD
jgi:hypothetical protein